MTNKEIHHVVRAYKLTNGSVHQQGIEHTQLCQLALAISLPTLHYGADYHKLT